MVRLVKSMLQNCIYASINFETRIRFLRFLKARGASGQRSALLV